MCPEELGLIWQQLASITGTQVLGNQLSVQLLCVGEVLRKTWGEVCTEDALILVREGRESLLVSFPGFVQRKTAG